jgi:2-methylisocitrate lyase-like PEP mutase family enzyme
MPSSKVQEIFRSLHRGNAPLLLPNAWDAGSAALIESLGAKAIATTSAGVCWAQGHADGDILPVDELVAAARAIARVVRVPLSVDMEGGYSNEPLAVAELAARLIHVGAVGINIEDGAHAPDLLCRKIEAIRRLAGAGVFINARVDVFLRSIATGDAAVEAVCRRAEVYQAAGCDGIFVPGLADLPAMSAIAQAIAPLPLNVMLLPGLPSFEMLHQHGVRRLSAGSALAQAAMGHAARLATEFLAGHGEAVFGSPGVGYATMNALFRGDDVNADPKVSSTGELLI